MKPNLRLNQPDTCTRSVEVRCPHRACKPFGMVVAHLLSCTVSLLAGTYQISWSTLDGGGGLSGGNGYAVSGTVGQPDSGFSCGGNFTLEGGFWSSESIGLPKLKIKRSGDTVIISWPGKFSGFTLQQSSDLSPGIVWLNVATPVILRDGEYTVESLTIGGLRFYRLEKN